MSFPFIINEKIVPVKQGSGIYIKKNVFSNGEMQDIQKAIDKYADQIEEYSENNNVKSNFLNFIDLFDYNPTIALGIEQAFEHIQKELYTTVCGRMHTVNYDEMHLRKINGATRVHIDGAISPTPALTPPNYINKPTNIRLYSVIVALNSDYEGGEFYFPRQDITVKLKAGEALIFPPYWTHPHGTNELNGTFRYTINTWFYDDIQVSKPVCE